MAEYVQSNATELVSLNSPITFDSSIPCNKGYVYHENGNGIFILRGVVNNSSCCFARYQVTFNGNIAVAEGGTVTPIGIALTVNGEQRVASKSIVTPAAAEAFNNVTSTAIITVPRGCCFTLAVEYVDATTEDATTTPTPTIAVTNGNLTIARIA